MESARKAMKTDESNFDLILKEAELLLSKQKTSTESSCSIATPSISPIVKRRSYGADFKNYKF